MRVVRAVRAGEAKLRGRMTSDVLIAGPPRCWDRRASALPFALFLLTVSSKWMVLDVFCVRELVSVAIYMGLGDLFLCSTV